ncbi:hypothetical protein FOWG_07678 [Fusarium oxysporum f. sp. lycopersici MN25]|uniref:Uncharacterized protein n=1 Tax=Fusarium oxysporum Fo47 TaxID=660027 RepID=W9K830_FUSOX|nr:hypothetical protein FOZG_09549 [Fusarium oxysporum Fo47]EWZ89775.1 hypothetical protein FOWG_07678 [Fusarium oxysporum f. sp. lycopersici MN25]
MEFFMMDPNVGKPSPAITLEETGPYSICLSVHPSISINTRSKAMSTESLRPQIPPCFPINYLHFLFHFSLQLVLSLTLAFRLHVCRAFSILSVRPFISFSSTQLSHCTFLALLNLLARSHFTGRFSTVAMGRATG